MAKDGKLKVPKRIAGMKVPKKVRKTANQALKVADHPLALELAAAALAAAAASLRKHGGPRAVAAAAEDKLDEVKEQTGKLRDLVAAAALDGARRLMEGVEPAAGRASKAPAKRRRKQPSATPATGAAPPDA